MCTIKLESRRGSANALRIYSAPFTIYHSTACARVTRVSYSYRVKSFIASGLRVILDRVPDWYMAALRRCGRFPSNLRVTSMSRGPCKLIRSDQKHMSRFPPRWFTFNGCGDCALRPGCLSARESHRRESLCGCACVCVCVCAWSGVLSSLAKVGLDLWTFRQGTLPLPCSILSFTLVCYS